MRSVMTAVLGHRARHVVPLLVLLTVALLAGLILAVLIALNNDKPRLKVSRQTVPNLTPALAAVGSAVPEKKKHRQPLFVIEDAQRRSKASKLIDPAESSILPVIPLAVAALFFLFLVGFVTGGVAGSVMSLVGFVGVPFLISALDYDEGYGEVQGLADVSIEFNPMRRRSK
eukprot:EG_transcript_13636